MNIITVWTQISYQEAYTTDSSSNYQSHIRNAEIVNRVKAIQEHLPSTLGSSRPAAAAGSSRSLQRPADRGPAAVALAPRPSAPASQRMDFRIRRASKSKRKSRSFRNSELESLWRGWPWISCPAHGRSSPRPKSSVWPVGELHALARPWVGLRRAVHRRADQASVSLRGWGGPWTWSSFQLD